MVPFNVIEMSPGHLHRGSEGNLTVECNDPEAVDSDIVDIIETIHSSLMPVCGSNDIRSVVWAKLQLNLANAVNALADIPVKSMLEQRDYRRCIALLMDELLAVTNRKEITLPKLTALPSQLVPRFITVPDFLFRLLGGKMLAIDPTVRTSMWWDLSQGKDTEIDYLNGVIVSEAKSMGIACPANERIVALIHDVERDQCKQGMSAENLLRILRS
ncbi:hypothetical protein A9Q81_15415 [Gammaproteobacteria bacterium 42_54_T18]|nr:hypothetical protein A9Q81_15415 [Gammaproteobacteria bacterium 42_54_T18]